MTILEEVDKTINGERQDQYGKAEDSFKIIADYWNVYLHNKHHPAFYLGAEDIARMMTLFKIARMHGQKYSRDNWRDAIGYLAIEADKLYPNNPEPGKITMMSPAEEDVYKYNMGLLNLGVPVGVRR